MATTAELLNTLNVLRAAAGKPTLKSWKESRAKLEAAIEMLKPKIVKTVDETPIVKKAVAKAQDKPKTKERLTKKAISRTSEFADWCRTQGINPKIARAKLRRAGVQKSKDGGYALTPKVKELLK